MAVKEVRLEIHQHGKGYQANIQDWVQNFTVLFDATT